MVQEMAMEERFTRCMRATVGDCERESGRDGSAQGE
jgi:hypothetical protein